MIIVFAELGGERLLGRAREIADSLGLRLVALCSKDDTKSQELIELGADEVISFDAKSVNEWSRVLSYLIRNQKQTRIVLLPSTPLGNAILGSTYALTSEQIGSFLDDADKISEQRASKTMHPSGRVLQSTASDKVSLWSLKVNSVPEPFGDSSRYGKVTTQETPRETEIKSPLVKDPDLDSLSSSLAILVGGAYIDNLDTEDRRKLEELAEKYSARLLKMSGKIEVVYGPCLAIEVNTAGRELPEFHSEVLSLNSSEAPISRIAKLSAITPNVLTVVNNLLKAN